VKPLFVLCLVSILLVGFPVRNAVGAEDWRSMGRADFPSYVAAVVFPGGQQLTAGNSVTWGKWTASFKNGKAIAAWFGKPSGERVMVYLTCENPVFGSMPCMLHLLQNTPQEGSGCFMVKEIKGADWGGELPRLGKYLFSFTCPSELKLK